MPLQCQVLSLIKSNFILYFIQTGHTERKYDIGTWTGCKLREFLFFFTCDYSAWILVCISLERTIPLYLPFKAKFICTKRNAKTVLCVLFIGMTGINGHLFFSHELKGSQCVWSDKVGMYFFENVWPWLDAVVSSYFPSLLMIICNSMIIYKLRAEKNAKSSKTGSSAISKNSLQATLILLGVSALFIFTTVPMTAYLVIVRAFKFKFSQPVYDILDMIFFLNFSCNIFFYSYSGSLFREEVKKLFCSQKNAIQPSSSNSTGTTGVSNQFFQSVGRPSKRGLLGKFNCILKKMYFFFIKFLFYAQIMKKVMLY